MTSRAACIGVIVAVSTLAIGITTLITGVLTSTRVDTPVAIGAAVTTVGVLGALVTGYRAARHYATDAADRAALAQLGAAILAHDAALAADPPDAQIARLVDLGRRPT
ncbi:hypothetical protein GT204_07725 [Streptomyces sp. SID4919]|uniref:hypothetical protein n=1 Tax=unclassified Streptomyces TaxID=2593676 RepID=UPI000823BB28|nr:MULTISPECIES: hypothetical protein [unclassified Streptomyces]MYY08794.1 hypothetical protein [Streptomyces sp. SID4919]SCK25296.1 hypothetical protein YW7DRAFT_01927 [Streptomyces sp. AmelKG-E11A]